MRALLLLISFIVVINAASCKPYAAYIEKYSKAYIAKDFPYWYLLGQDYTESNCKFIISKDGVGSESPAQITWNVWKHYLKPYGIHNLRSIDSFTKAQVLIMRRIIKHSKYNELWISFQAYNGGWLVKKEIKRAGTTIQPIVKQYCRRKNIRFKNGTVRNACDINYEYPHKIEDYTYKFYKSLIKETTWSMW